VCTPSRGHPGILRRHVRRGTPLGRGAGRAAACPGTRPDQERRGARPGSARLVVRPGYADPGSPQDRAGHENRWNGGDRGADRGPSGRGTRRDDVRLNTRRGHGAGGNRPGQVRPGTRRSRGGPGRNRSRGGPGRHLSCEPGARRSHEPGGSRRSQVTPETRQSRGRHRSRRCRGRGGSHHCPAPLAPVALAPVRVATRQPASPRCHPRHPDPAAEGRTHSRARRSRAIADWRTNRLASRRDVGPREAGHADSGGEPRPPTPPPRSPLQPLLLT
jgi:hypothetical protein